MVSWTNSNSDFETHQISLISIKSKWLNTVFSYYELLNNRYEKIPKIEAMIFPVLAIHSHDIPKAIRSMYGFKQMLTFGVDGKCYNCYHIWHTWINPAQMLHGAGIFTYIYPKNGPVL